MSKVIPLWKRMLFPELRAKGLTIKRISQELEISFSSGRKLWRKYRDNGLVGLKPYEHEILESFDPKVVESASNMKLLHPRWGVRKIATELKLLEDLKGLDTPSYVELYRYYVKNIPKLMGRCLHDVEPSSKKYEGWAESAHECWQLDFKEQVRSKKLGIISVLNIQDEATSAALGSFVYTCSPNSKIPPLTFESVRSSLRLAFERWGLPRKIRTDRGSSFTSNKHCPSHFTLWLIGLNIEHMRNPPHSPNYNPKVEKYNGTYTNWVLDRIDELTIEQLKDLSDYTTDFYNNHFPSRAKGCNNEPIAKVYPEIYIKLRPYTIEEELLFFDLCRIKDYLTQFRWERSVDFSGKCNIFSCSLYVTRDMGGKKVLITYNKENNTLCFWDSEINLLKEHSFRIVSIKELTGFDTPFE